jgi:hypothetical protein
MQMRGGVLNVVVFVLPCAALGGQHCATMNIHEISEREFVPPFGPWGLLFIDPEIPPGEFVVAMQSDEFVLVSRGRLVLAPRVSLIRDKLPLGDEMPGMVERRLVQSHSHGFVVPYAEATTAVPQPLAIGPSTFTILILTNSWMPQVYL